MPEPGPGRSVRNLQAIKGGSYTLTLPKWWVEKRGLRKHAEVVMVEDGPALKLIPEGLLRLKQRAEIDIDALPDPKALRYAIWTYYMQGADEIVVRSRAVLPAAVKRQLREVRLDLPGIEIADEGGHSVRFALPSGVAGLGLDALLKAMGELALSTLADAIQAVGDDSLDLASGVVGREAEILRVYRSIIRQVVLCARSPDVAHAGGIGESRDLIIDALLARDMSRTVSHSVYAAKHFLRYGRQLGRSGYRKSLQSLGEVALEMHRLALQAFFEKDFPKVVKVTRLMGDAKRLDETIARKALESSKDVGFVATVLLIARELRRIAGYAVALADVAANRMFAPATVPA